MTSAAQSPVTFEPQPNFGRVRIKLGMHVVGAIEESCGRVLWYVILPPATSARFRRAVSIEQAQGDARELVSQWLEAAELVGVGAQPA
jgi:hypothetical protein